MERASRVTWYQITIFASCPSSPVQKCLLGTSQTLLKLHPPDAGCAFFQNASIPIQTKKHAKGRRKIDLWRVLFTGSAAGPAAVYHLRRIARYFSVPAKTAASCRGPCSISHSTVTTSHSRRKKDCAILYLQAPSSKRCTVSTPKTPERCTPSHSPNIRNCGILFTSSCQGCLRDNLRLSTRHSRNPKKHGILIIASSFNRPGGTERHGNRYYETLPSRQIPW